MATVTDTDLQQLKDLIIAGNIATQQQIADLALGTQQQIADLALSTQQQIADLALSTQQQINDGNATMQKQVAEMDKRIEVGFTNVETKFTKIEGDIGTLSSSIQNFEKRMSEMKNDQRAQDNRFFSLSIFIITFAVGIAAKLAKLY